MVATVFPTTELPLQAQYPFPRRSLMPLKQGYLWQIQTGVVKTVTWQEDGTSVILGLWGAGDLVGRALSTADPLQLECLTKVEAQLIAVDQLSLFSEALVRSTQRSQELLEIVHCRNMESALLRLLEWLAKRFGQAVEQGRFIDLRLTHQDIADLIGSTRVTVTRLINEFEKQGIIQRQHQQFILLPQHTATWHYEI